MAHYKPPFMGSNERRMNQFIIFVSTVVAIIIFIILVLQGFKSDSTNFLFHGTITVSNGIMEAKVMTSQDGKDISINPLYLNVNGFQHATCTTIEKVSTCTALITEDIIVTFSAYHCSIEGPGIKISPSTVREVFSMICKDPIFLLPP